MRILVVQTTRMGDMIQTGPLISQLRAKHPEAHIAVLSRGLAKMVADRHPDVDEVVLYDENLMYHDIRSGDSKRLLRAYRNAEEIVATLREKQFDEAYNMTHSVASAMLLSLAGIPRVVGAHLSEDWRFVLRGSWTTYFFTSVFSRDYNDLNLCDIDRSFAEDAPPCRYLSFETGDEEDSHISAMLAEAGITDDAFLVAMQLGASEQNKRWAERRFAELAALLKARYNATILLVGVEEEKAYGEIFEGHAPGLATHLFGKTSVPQLAALLRRCRLLVTNDTGTMHLAAAVQCPIVVVSVGHVHFRETGPYAEGAIAIESQRRTLGRSDYVPGGLEERDRITGAQALRAVELVLQSRDHHQVPQIDDAPEFSAVDLYWSAFAPDGYLQFYPIIRRPLTQRDILRMAYRAMWLAHLSPQASDAARENEAITRSLASFAGPDNDTITGWIDPSSDALKRLASKADRGIAETEKLLTMLKTQGAMSQARQQVNALMALDEETRVFSELHPELRPLVLLARFERENLEGADPVTLARTTREIYAGMATRARLLHQKLAQIRAQFP